MVSNQKITRKSLVTWDINRLVKEILSGIHLTGRSFFLDSLSWETESADSQIAVARDSSDAG